MPKKGYKSITVTDSLRDWVQRTAKVEDLSMIGLIRMMMVKCYPENVPYKEGRIHAERVFMGAMGPTASEEDKASARACYLDTLATLGETKALKMGQCSNCGAWLVSVKGELVCPKKCREVKS